MRALQPPTTPPIMVADTVGFLRHLPNHLIASFRSTLEEALDAELLLLIVDGADPEWQDHLEVTREVLRQVGAATIPSLVVVNKRDRMAAAAFAPIAAELPNALCRSARAANDVAFVRAHLAAHFAERWESAELFVPHGAASVQAEVWARARVLSHRNDEAGAYLSVRAEPALLARWRARSSGHHSV